MIFKLIYVNKYIQKSFWNTQQITRVKINHPRENIIFS